jgi:hypothetical protein
LDALTETAVSGRNIGALRSVFVKIHSWKTQNSHGQTSKYLKTLKGLDIEYFDRLLELAPFEETEKLWLLIGKLKVNHCNLSESIAIASFLFGRENVPILDTRLAQFFARRIPVEEVDEPTSLVLPLIPIINFRFEDGGSGKVRLAVYTPKAFNDNLSRYLNHFVPECTRIAEELNRPGFTYTDINGNFAHFSPVDVEMAIFSFATQNLHLF